MNEPNHVGTRRRILHGLERLSRRERNLLEVAGHQVLEKRRKSVVSFERLVALGLISPVGKLTIEGGRTLRLLKRQEGDDL